MHRILFMLAFIVGVHFLSFAQPDFQRLYQSHTNSLAFANGMQVTLDGGCVLVGRDSANAAKDYDVYVVKTAPNGDTLWARSYGTAGPEYGQYVIQSADGGYMIAGVTVNATADVYLLKTDANGDTLWTRILGDVGDDEANFVQQTNDGNFIVAGYTSSFGAGAYDYFLMKLDGNGNTLWSKTYGTALDELAYTVFQSGDKGYIIAGAAFTPGGTIDAYAVKTDSMGVEEWSKYYGTADTDWGYMMRPTSDGGFALTGYVGAPGGGTDAMLIKTDAAGDTLWTRTYGGWNYEQGLNVIETNSGGYAIAGSVYNGGLGGSDAMLLKTDNAGNMQYCRGFGSIVDDWTPGLAQLSDNSFVLGGYSNGLGNGTYNFYLVRTDTAGHTVGYCNEAFTTVQQTSAAFTVTTLTTTVLPLTLSAAQFATSIDSAVVQTEGCNSLGKQQSFLTGEAKALRLYPNPSNGMFSIECDQVTSSKVSLSVHNIFGQQVYCETMHNQTGLVKKDLELRGLAPGSYVVRLSDGDKTRSSKLLIVK